MYLNVLLEKIKELKGYYSLNIHRVKQRNTEIHKEEN
jgi:hypothetical protein